MLSQPGTLNPYVYGLNNPVMYTDPSGKMIDPVTASLIGGAAIGAAGYLITITSARQAFRLTDFLIATGTGALSGLLITTGLPTLTSIGTSMAFSGLGYLTASSVMGSGFCLRDFGIAIGVGALSGWLTPSFAHWSVWRNMSIVGGVLPDYTGAMALQTMMNILQYSLLEWSHGSSPTRQGVAWSAITGALAGRIGGAYHAGPEFDMVIVNYGDFLDYFIRAAWMEYYRSLGREFMHNLPRSAIATFVINLPDLSSN